MNLVVILKQILGEFLNKSKDVSLKEAKEMNDLKLQIISLTKKSETEEVILTKKVEEAVAKADFLKERVETLELEMSEAEELTNQLKEAMEKWVK